MKKNNKIDPEEANMSRMNEYFRVGTMKTLDKKQPRYPMFDREERLDELSKGESYGKE